MTYDGHGELRVEARLEKTGELLAVEGGAEPYVKDFEVTAGGAGDAKWKTAARNERAFVAPPCAVGSCRIRYRYELRTAAKRLDDLDIASEEGEVLEAPPSTWLAAPTEASSGRIRFRVTTTASTAFVTGVFRAHDRASENDNVWDIALGDLWTAPYSAFGPLRKRKIIVALPNPPSPSSSSEAKVGQAAPPSTPTGAAGGSPVEIAIAPGALAIADDEIVSWVSDCGRAIAGYFGRFPMTEALVLLTPARGRWVGEGKTLSGGGGAIFMRIGEHAPVRALRDDWVLVHEMTHLAFPSVPREHDWAEEGLATYVEPFARARAGLLSVEEAWRGLVEGVPNGLPQAGDKGLDHTPTWGRTYWGGALFYLLADVEIRKRTKNKLGLEHALRGILDAGGNNAHRWPLDDAFTAGDKATGVPVLRELHEAMASTPHPVDLAALWRELGITSSRGSLKLDDNAPLAAVRRAITTPD